MAGFSSKSAPAVKACLPWYGAVWWCQVREWLVRVLVSGANVRMVGTSCRPRSTTPADDLTRLSLTVPCARRCSHPGATPGMTWRHSRDESQPGPRSAAGYFVLALEMFPRLGWPSCSSSPYYAHPARRMEPARVIHATGSGTCRLNTPPADTSPTPPRPLTSLHCCVMSASAHS